MPTWKLIPGQTEEGHRTITESTTGTVACGDSWCTGKCGLPALVLDFKGRELRAFGHMVATGPVFQVFRVPWEGEKIPVSLGTDTPEEVIKRFWM